MSGILLPACSIFFSALLCIIYFSKKRINLLENKMYSIMIISIVIDSIFKLQIALNIRDVYDSHWGFLLAMSIINALLGSVILFKPFESLAVLTMVCGAILMIVELMSIFEDVSIISRVGKFEKFEKEIDKKINNVKK